VTAIGLLLANLCEVPWDVPSQVSPDVWVFWMKVMARTRNQLAAILVWKTTGAESRSDSGDLSRWQIR
jgi:hypothetical protein